MENQDDKIQLNKGFNPEQYDKQYNPQYNPQHNQQYDYISDQKTSDKEDNQFSFISPEVEENAEEIKSSDDIDSAESETLDDENLVSPFAYDPPKIKKSGVLKNMGTFFSKIFKFE